MTFADAALYATSTCVTFGAVFLKGFQHKNVIGNHKRTVFFTSYAMAVFDVASTIVIVKGGWSIAISAGTGVAFGMVAAMTLHDRIFKKPEPHVMTRIHTTTKENGGKPPKPRR